MGAAIAEAICSEGGAVTITDVLLERGEETAAKLRAKGYEAIFAALDVRMESQWAAVVCDILTRRGRIDCLVNNAGYLITGNIEHITLDEIKKLYDVNVFGGFLGMQAVMPAMKAQAKGAIVNIASNATQRTISESLPYGSSKAAFASLSKSVAMFGAEFGIRVNTVHPGPTATEMILGPGGGPALPQLTSMIASIPMRRLGQPSDIASVVAFLLSDDAGYMTAAEIFVDGGVTPAG
jgi:3alpha(or 20beta)-hydroxysteroid dehydrogenase